MHTSALETVLSENRLNEPTPRTDPLSRGNENRSPGAEIYPDNGAGGSTQPDVHNRASTHLGIIESFHQALRPRWVPRDLQSDEAAIKSSLIAYSALQRQQEAVTMRTLPLDPASDLDGLDQELARHLINLYWSTSHLTWLLSYRPAITDSLLHGGPYISKLLLNAIYFSSSLYSGRVALRTDPADAKTAGMGFYHRFRQLLATEIDNPSIPTALGLLLCAISLVARGEATVGSVLCGTAVHMVMELHSSPLDVNSPSSPSGHQKYQRPLLSILETEMRDRLYLGAYSVDVSLALYLGRTPTFDRLEDVVPNGILDTYEELEDWQPHIEASAPGSSTPEYYAPFPAYAVSTSMSMFNLLKICSRVIRAFYGGRGTLPEAFEQLWHAKSELEDQLEDWQRSLPGHLHFDQKSTPPRPPHQIALM